jgi:hypothetical protein
MITEELKEATRQENQRLTDLVTKPVPHFGRETCDQVVGEIFDLMRAHYHEVAHHPDIPPECDEGRYRTAEKVGLLRIYTVRVQDFLVGYWVGMVATSLHYKSSLQARQDTLFVHPDYRQGLVGYRFLKWVDQQLALEDVEIVYQHFKRLPDDRLNLEPLFIRMGYRPIYEVLWKRLREPRS